VTDKTVSDARATLKRRLFVALCALTLWAVVIESRLVHLQVLQHDALARRADRQQQSTRDLPAKRGEILDRHGRVLAYSVDARTIVAVPTELGDPAQVAATLCQALDDCSRADRRALADRIRRGKQFAYVRRQASPEQAKRVEALALDGITFITESQRRYPNRELASHLLGYVGTDSVGLGGIESTHDSLIKGKPGTVIVQIDARRHAFSRVERPPTAGATLELTIDRNLQFIVERELRRGVAENQARAGSAVVMDPRNGEILAMASWPTFNPNVYRDANDEERRNRSVQDLYEPGSIFKIVTASAALEQNLIRPDDLIDARGGTLRVGPHTFTDTHDYGVLSFTDVIVKSSNVGAIKIGFSLGSDRLGQYVRRFGFGRPISPDFPGENRGIVSDPATWSASSLASVSFGHEIGVTPLQMVGAASSVANGGQLMEPRVVRAVYRGNRRFAVKPKVMRRTTTTETAAALTTILEQVVERGTATVAQIPGFTIAGKTGTARKVVNGRYSRTDYHASFVGFVPSRDPAVAIIVVVDSPRAGTIYGGSVAAPIFQRIAEAALRHLGVAPTVNAAPPVLVARRPSGTPASPEPGPVVSFVADGRPGTVPDVRGMSARDAMRTLVKFGLSPRMTGDGVVAAQHPPPGAPVEAGALCELILQRAPAARAPETVLQ